MIQEFLELLAWLGLDFLDYKHQKEISRKEKKDGIKRPFQKYLLQPGFKVLIVAILLICMGSFLFFSYRNSFIYPDKTKKEISLIGNWIIKWNDKFGNYPKSLYEAIGNNPMKKEWLKDAWDRDYEYLVSDRENSFLLRSAGKDGQFETEDDISFK